MATAKHIALKVLFALAASAPLASFSAIPVRWTTDAYKVKPLVYECFHGETLDLAAALTAYGEPLDFAGKSAKLYWQTNGMDAAWWSTNAFVRADGEVTNILAAVWSGAYDTGAASVNGFIGLEGENYRAAFTLNFRASPGFAPASLPMPTKTIDWANVENANVESAPFVVKGGAGGVTLAQVTNVANDRIDAKVAPWAMKGQPQPTGSVTNVYTNGVSAVVGGVARITIPNASGVNTNAVCGIITNHVTSGYLCTVAAASAMTNALPAWTKAATKPTYTAAEVGARPVDWMPSASEVGALATNAVTEAIAKGEYKINGDFSVGKKLPEQWIPSSPVDPRIADIYYIDFVEEGHYALVAPGLAPPGAVADYTPNEDASVLSFNFAIDDTYEPYPQRFTKGMDYVPYGRLALTNDLPTPATPAFANAFAAKATEGRVSALSNTVAQWENYWHGERVRLSVTNYYGNTSGELPRLRIEEFDHSVTNAGAVTNIYRVVWDETTRQTNYMAVTDAKVNSISGTVMQASWRQTNNQLANKAPRAWGDVTSGGEAAPPNTVWHTAPNTVFAGGTEYAHVAVGDGTICVLVDKGASVFTEGAEGQFRFKDQTGQNYFGFDVRQSYTLGCRTDGISVDQSTHIVSLTYDLTSEDNPEVLVCTNLTEGTWGVATVEWEQNPPVGTKICYINCGTAPQGYYQAQMHYAGGSKFITNMMADLTGGIAATNETGIGTATHLPIYPAITSTGVVWRVNWGN